MIEVLLSTTEGSRWVWSGDPDVTSDAPSGWLPAADTSHTDGADVVEVHALNAEQLAIIGTIDAPASYYETIRRSRPRVRRDGSWLPQRAAEAFVAGLDWTIAVGLYLVVLALTQGADPAKAQAVVYETAGGD